MHTREKEAAGLPSVVIGHLPRAFVSHVGGHDAAWNQVCERVPAPYVDALIAAKLANRLVYQEGVTFVASTGDQQLADLALVYLQSEQQVDELLKDVAGAELQHGDKISAILRKGGARALLR